MAPRWNGQRPTLTHALDRDVYQVVRKFQDEQERSSSKKKHLTVHEVYERIRKSNSSLNRKNKKLLEDSIERVISVIEDEIADNEEGSIASDFEGIDDEVDDAGQQQPVNTINQLITGGWGFAGSVPKPPIDKPGAAAAAGENGSGTGTSTPTKKEALRKSAKDGLSQNKKREILQTAESSSKRRKGDKIDRSAPTNLSLEDLGGVEGVIHDLTELIALPMLYPEAYISSGIQPTRGVLLYGPPGCGKTMIANAFAAELGVSFIPISAPSVVSGMSGESEKKLRECFDEAKRLAPCLMFIDEIDAIAPKREGAQREMEKRIVAQMLTCMDDLALDKTDGKPVIVLAATNRPDSLDPALRRAGRFNKEINLNVPNESSREKILRALTRKLRVSGNFDYAHLAKMTPGFVGADLTDLVTTAGVSATKRLLDMLKAEVRTLEDSGDGVDQMNIDNPPSASAAAPESSLQVLRDLIWRAQSSLSTPELESIAITNQDFVNAIPKVQPSSKREGFATIPNTTWADIGALHSVRDELRMAIVEPIRRPDRYERVGITAPSGVLLWGPPGCGKTLLAKAVANESRANFISVKGPELLNKYVGESERAVRQVFLRARSSVPCVIFFDELDALVPRRDDSLSEASARVVNTLLTELDGLDNRAGIYVIAATNRPDIIDPAMLRPGRLGSLLFVDLPGPDERTEIIKTLAKARRTPLAQDVDLASIATHEKCSGFSGADLESLLRTAAVESLRRTEQQFAAIDSSETEIFVQATDFERALDKVKASVVDGAKYRRLALRSEWTTRS